MSVFFNAAFHLKCAKHVWCGFRWTESRLSCNRSKTTKSQYGKFSEKLIAWYFHPPTSRVPLHGERIAAMPDRDLGSQTSLSNKIDVAQLGRVHPSNLWMLQTRHQNIPSASAFCWLGLLPNFDWHCVHPVKSCPLHPAAKPLFLILLHGKRGLGFTLFHL